MSFEKKLYEALQISYAAIDMLCQQVTSGGVGDFNDAQFANLLNEAQSKAFNALNDYELHNNLQTAAQCHTVAF